MSWKEGELIKCKGCSGCYDNGRNCPFGRARDDLVKIKIDATQKIKEQK